VVKGIAERIKRFVEVEAVHTLEGKTVPLRIHWHDGRTFEVDEVLDEQNRASLKVGGFGRRYLIRVKKQETYLFLEDTHWFVEEIVPESETVL
jgi:hypothetical protein